MTEEREAPPAKDYLGDSVYAEFDGYYIILETNNGLPDDPSNRIALEPEVLNALIRFGIDRGIIQVGEANGR